MNLKNLSMFLCLLMVMCICIGTVSAASNDTAYESNSSDVAVLEAEEPLSDVKSDDLLEMQGENISEMESKNDTANMTSEKPDMSLQSNESDETQREKSLNSTQTLSFDDLQKLIYKSQPGSVLRLTNSFKYTGAMGGEGIVISKSITIMGKNDCIIDAMGKSRIFRVAANCKVTISGITFKNGYCRGTVSKSQNGAAIIAFKGASLTVRNCVFTNNKVYNANGAAIYGSENTMVKIMNSKFMTNDAVRTSKVSWNKFKRGIGSAIYVNIGSILRVDNSIFQKNTAYASTIYVASYENGRYSQSTAMINNCRFYYNTAKINSIFYLDKFSRGSVGATTVFKGNRVYDGGAILRFDASKYAVIKNCKFVKNVAVNGIVYLGDFKDSRLGYGSSNVKVSTCSFYYNRAYCGGAIFSQSGKLNVISTFFLGNAATKNGGAIATNNKGTLKFYNCNFRSNRAMYGGAIYSYIKSATASKCYFISNYASRAGPDVYGWPKNY